MADTNILILGSGGQVGTELTVKLREIYGEAHVWSSDIKPAEGVLAEGQYIMLNAMDARGISDFVAENKITQIYHLAALLSGTAEKNPELGWQLNMESLLHVLNIARDQKLHRVYWPSSIAAFGPDTPRIDTPQQCIMNPNTVYGISKLAGERWCEYYFKRWGVDTRSLRYPGLISWASEPGGGTTDYAVHIFYEALRTGRYTSFLSADTALPMLYMPDAIKATLDIMHADSDKLSVRDSYNLAGFTITPAQLAEEIKKHIPSFTIDYEPDFRQAIANSWPASIDDSVARKDWGWKNDFDLAAMTADMLENLRLKINKAAQDEYAV